MPDAQGNFKGIFIKTVPWDHNKYHCENCGVSYDTITLDGECSECGCYLTLKDDEEK
jgi:DNA polymerase II large subunit